MIEGNLEFGFKCQNNMMNNLTNEEEGIERFRCCRSMTDEAIVKLKYYQC